jgi:hypothetical protein
MGLSTQQNAMTAAKPARENFLAAPETLHWQRHPPPGFFQPGPRRVKSLRRRHDFLACALLRVT